MPSKGRSVAKDLEFNIKAQDNASATFEKIGSTAKSSLGQVDDAFDKIESSSKSAVDGVATKLQELYEDTKAAEVAAEQLSQALGPELAGRTDLDGVISELKRMGLTAEDVTNNADQLAAKLRQLDEGNVGGKLGQSLNTARGQTEKLSDSARGAHSALANMIGNTAQDLGAFTGIAGSSGVALGQMAEYASDATLAGEGLGSSLRSMATVAGPIAGISLLVGLISKELQRDAAAAEQAKARSEAYFKAMEDGHSVLAALRQELEQTGQLKFEGLGDIAPALARMNVSVEEFSRLAEGPPEKLSAWAQAQRKLVHEGTQGYADMRSIVFALTEANDSAATAEERHRITTEILGTSTDKAATAAERAATAERHREAQMEASKAATDGWAKIQGEAADQIDRVNKLLNDQADALDEQASAAKSAADSGVAVQEAMIGFADSLQAEKDAATGAVEAVQQHGAKSTEAAAAARAYSDSIRAARDSAVSLSDAVVRQAQDQAKANGKTLDARQVLDVQNTSLLNTAATASGPVRQSILDYIGTLNQIPAEKKAEILAHVAEGDLAGAKKLLDAASDPRKAALDAEARRVAAESAKLDKAADERDAPLNANTHGTDRQEAAKLDAAAAARLADITAVGIQIPEVAHALDTASNSRTAAINALGIGIGGVSGALDSAASSRTAAINAVGIGIGGVQGAIDGIHGKTVFVDIVARRIGSFLPLAAKGISAIANRFGAIAGENYQPEILNDKIIIDRPTLVPAGTEVTGEAETRQRLQSGGLGGGDTFNIHLHPREDTAVATIAAFREEMWRRGAKPSTRSRSWAS
jgi:hypothetical protein